MFRFGRRAVVGFAMPRRSLVSRLFNKQWLHVEPNELTIIEFTLIIRYATTIGERKKWVEMRIKASGGGFVDIDNAGWFAFLPHHWEKLYWKAEQRLLKVEVDWRLSWVQLGFEQFLEAKITLKSCKISWKTLQTSEFLENFWSVPPPQSVASVSRFNPNEILDFHTRNPTHSSSVNLSTHNDTLNHKILMTKHNLSLYPSLLVFVPFFCVVSATRRQPNDERKARVVLEHIALFTV